MEHNDMGSQELLEEYCEILSKYSFVETKQQELKAIKSIVEYSAVDFLRKLRKVKKVSMRQISKKLEISATYYSDIENRKRKLSDQTFQWIAQALNDFP